VVIRMKKLVSIHIGQLHASRHPTIIYTLLGSCVAVCLFDPVAKIGGMNHILMPGCADFRHGGTAGRYGDNAIRMLIKRIVNLGGSLEHLVAKVFGGAHMLQESSKEYSTGVKNAQGAIACLQGHHVPILKRDLGGSDTRKIYFHTDTGEVFLKRMGPGAQRRMQGDGNDDSSFLLK
jgi:chemotaxis protein CheD